MSLFRIIILSLLVTFLSGSLAIAADLSNMTVIRDIKLLSNPEELRVLVLTDDKAMKLPSVIIVNDKLLQLDIANSYTEPAKRSFSIDDSYLEKIEIYQLNEETVRVRFHMLAPIVKDGSNTWKDDQGFILSLKRNTTNLAGKVKKDERKAQVKSDNEIENSFPTIFKGEGAKVESSEITVKDGEGNIGINPVIKMISSLAVVVGFFLVGAYIFKKKVLNKGVTGNGKLIRVLDRGFIDIKKGVAIVDVAGEVLVLGISGENITMLTKLESEQALERLKPFYKNNDENAFADTYKKVASGMNEEASESVVDKIRKLKPLK